MDVGQILRDVREPPPSCLQSHAGSPCTGSLGDASPWRGGRTTPPSEPSSWPREENRQPGARSGP